MKICYGQNIILKKKYMLLNLLVSDILETRHSPCKLVIEVNKFVIVTAILYDGSIANCKHMLQA